MRGQDALWRRAVALPSPSCGEKVETADRPLREGRMRGGAEPRLPTASYTIQATTPNATTIPTIPGINRNT